MRMSKVIALVDPHTSGHHIPYLKFFSETLLGLGHTVVVFNAAPKILQDWAAAHLSEADQNRMRVYPLQDAHRIPVISPFISRLLLTPLRWWQTARTIRRGFKAFNLTPDLVFFAWPEIRRELRTI